MESPLDQIRLLSFSLIFMLFINTATLLST